MHKFKQNLTKPCNITGCSSNFQSPRSTAAVVLSTVPQGDHAEGENGIVGYWDAQTCPVLSFLSLSAQIYSHCRWGGLPFALAWMEGFARPAFHK